MLCICYVVCPWDLSTFYCPKYINIFGGNTQIRIVSNLQVLVVGHCSGINPIVNCSFARKDNERLSEL